ncbi:hypothetical protein [Hydrogenophilus thermoluteolus]|uniref:hypothetical protein n=1 Tax=Hydrogenophilus thermoluteolus TaxID=297 RepID=UPI003F668441
MREAQEEVGLAPERVTILGALPDYVTVTGYRVTPLIAWSDALGPLAPDPFEVAEVFSRHLPISQTPTAICA